MRNIIVTGATGGLGKAIVNRLTMNSDVCVWAIDLKQDVLESCYGNSQNVRTISCNLSDETEIVNMVKFIVSESNGIDGLVHCAGISSFTPIHMIKQKKIENIFQIHVYAAMILCSQIAKKGVANKGCSIVLFSSVAAHEGSSGNSIYAAAKSALEGFVHSAANDFADRGIRLNAIVPGDINAGMFRAFLEQLSEEQRNAREEKYPLGYGKDKDIASIVNFLLSEDSSWMTGQCYIIDGGHSVHRV